MFTAKTRRESPAVNAGSMADIAFLLLIFFLVTTTIQEDRGVLVKLPRWDPEAPVTPTSEVLTVILDADGRLMVEGERATPGALPDLLREYILSPERTPRQATVSLIHDRSTGYGAYVGVYDALLAGYRDLWDGEAERRFGQAYAELSDGERAEVRERIPLTISEAEPNDVRGVGGR
ncbi:ExbD/TolR family protein [Lewinella sp. IMCC34183]|uniref:ExbD/TolR family protein n=1 Tax=Lewinella sp. IMCC34183 TaxID=2248762 RepID=UPI000E257680|nr:biopolymer transporter ExbD [Lewinella sp. IMCC34183]